jgi:integrase
VAKRRGNKEGTIYKRKDGRWYAQVSVNGQRLTKYGNTQGEVREWLKETINQVDRGTGVAAPHTLEDCLPAWLEAVKPSIRPNSYKTYRTNSVDPVVEPAHKIKSSPSLLNASA